MGGWEKDGDGNYRLVIEDEDPFMKFDRDFEEKNLENWSKLVIAKEEKKKFYKGDGNSIDELVSDDGLPSGMPSNKQSREEADAHMRNTANCLNFLDQLEAKNKNFEDSNSEIANNLKLNYVEVKSEMFIPNSEPSNLTHAKNSVPEIENFHEESPRNDEC